MFCNNCGIENPSYARVCRNCGRPFQRGISTMTSRCLHCRTANPADANYCWQCGQPLHQEADAPGPDFFVPPPSSAPTPGVPSVQGTPQAGGAPMVQNTPPTHTGLPAGHEAFSSSPKELASQQHGLQASSSPHTLSPQASHFSSTSQPSAPSSLSPQTAASQPNPFASAHQPSASSLKASTPQQAPSQASSAPRKASPLRRAVSGGSTVKTIIIVAVVVAVVAAGAIVAANRFLSHPQPLINITSGYKVGNALAGASGTSLHIGGQKFASNSAITFLLDGHAAPGNPSTHSDANGNFSTNVTITNAWSIGTHTLTATDASNDSTKNSISVTIVQPGQANTPGPDGAPPDDATFTLNIPVNGRNNAVNQPFTNNQEALHITGHPDPAGGTVCLDSDNGQQASSSYVDTNGGSFTETYSFSCKGSYKSGKISYTETLISDVVSFPDTGVSCTLTSPQLNQQVTGSYTSNDTFTGTWTYGPIPTSAFNCSDGSTTFFYSSNQGTWTGTVSGLQK